MSKYNPYFHTNNATKSTPTLVLRDNPVSLPQVLIPILAVVFF